MITNDDVYRQLEAIEKHDEDEELKNILIGLKGEERERIKDLYSLAYSRGWWTAVFSTQASGVIKKRVDEMLEILGRERHALPRT